MPEAKADLDFWINSGNKPVLKKITQLLESVSTTPYEGIGKPEPLKDSEVKRILGTLDQLNEGPDFIKDPFIVGENVLINDGPFANFNATVEEINDEKKRLKVSVKIFGRRTPVDIEFGQVKKI